MPDLRAFTRAVCSRPWAPLLLLSSAAWAAIILRDLGIASVSYCSWDGISAERGVAGIRGALLLAGPAELAGWWMLMLVATMTPLLGPAILHVLQSSLRRKRLQGLLLLIAGYGLVWLCAGALMVPFAIGVRSAAGPIAATAIAAALVAGWHSTPARRYCLARCHSHGRIDPFGWRSAASCFACGIEAGAWCAGSCWALMTAALLLPVPHHLSMAVTALLIAGERFGLLRPLLVPGSGTVPRGSGEVRARAA